MREIKFRNFDSKDRTSVAYRNQVIGLIHSGDSEIIGNIYENPELLKS